MQMVNFPSPECSSPIISTELSAQWSLLKRTRYQLQLTDAVQLHGRLSRLMVINFDESSCTEVGVRRRWSTVSFIFRGAMNPCVVIATARIDSAPFSFRSVREYDLIDDNVREYYLERHVRRIATGDIGFSGDRCALHREITHFWILCGYNVSPPCHYASSWDGV